MRLILAVDAIFPPLTGIGRYAYELATRLPALGQFERIRYLGLWNWASVEDSLSADAGRALLSPQWYALLRRQMARRRWAVRWYDRLGEAWRGRLLRNEGASVLHSPNYFLPPHGGPAVATVHDLSILRYPETHVAAARHYFGLAFERSLRRAHALITDSDSVRQELIRDHSVAPDRVTTIPLGVDAAFRPRPVDEVRRPLSRYGLQPGEYVLSVATLEPRKNLGRLIAAFAGLPAPLRARHRLVLAGAGGWLNDDLLAAIDRGRAQGWLVNLGYVPQSDLPALYAGASGLALISLYEGFGLPVLEAMASGIPVLVSSAPALQEIAAGAALLADPHDTRDVACQLERLLTDDAWRARSVEAGLRRAAELTWERCTRHTAEVYRLAAQWAGHDTAAPY